MLAFVTTHLRSVGVSNLILKDASFSSSHLNFSDRVLDKGANACGQGDPAFDGIVDDVLIYVEIKEIDGSGGTLGSAGPCYIRSIGKLPVYGTMVFDVEDVGSLASQFEEVILHEMGHVFGIGTIWDTLGLLNYKRGNCQRSKTVSFTGAVAKAEYAALPGSSGGNVPVEDDYGPGTKCGHWDEAEFGNELMTGFLNGGVFNPISRVTVGSLDDLGYQVSFSAADPYGLSAGSSLQSQGQPLDFDEEILTPIGVVGEDGSLIQTE